jgi:hypothetical protein
LQRRIGLDALGRRAHLVLENQRQDFDQTAEADHQDDENGHQDDVLFEFLVCPAHARSPQ